MRYLVANVLRRIVGYRNVSVSPYFLYFQDRTRFVICNGNCSMILLQIGKKNAMLVHIRQAAHL